MTTTSSTCVWQPDKHESYDNSVAKGKINRDRGNTAVVLMRRTSARHSASRLPVQSTMLREVRSWANHSQGVRRRQISGRTNMSAKISVTRTGEFPSATWPGSQHLARRNSFLPSAPAATRDHAADGCAASVRRLVRSMRWLLTSSHGSSEYPAPTGLQASGTCGPERVEFGALNFCSGGAAVARLAHNQEVVGSIPTPATSSGDGLGIGSMTWGGFFVPTAPSGRADESATCPAVARSFEGRLA